MFENTPAVELAIGRSSVRQRILALLMDESGCRLHLREIQRRAGTSPGTASRELAKLVAAGLIDREAEGNQVYFRASASPLATMLRTLLVAMPAPAFGPRPPRLPRLKNARTGAAAITGPSLPDAAGGESATPQMPVTTEASAVDTSPKDSEVIAEVIWPTGEPLATEATPRVIRPAVHDRAALSPAFAAPAAPPSASARVAEPKPQPATPAATPAPTSAASAAEPVALRSTTDETAVAPDPFGLQVAGRLAESVRSIYGQALRGIYLYGARASGPASADADVEVIIVLERVDHYGAELERTSHACAALSHELGLVVSRIFVSEASWNGGAYGALPSIRAEAAAV
jgi:DNA-binding transcriptional ArsR family regulator